MSNVKIKIIVWCCEAMQHVGHTAVCILNTAHIFHVTLLYKQIYSQLISQWVLLLLHVSAAVCSEICSSSDNN